MKTRKISQKRLNTLLDESLFISEDKTPTCEELKNIDKTEPFIEEYDAPSIEDYENCENYPNSPTYPFRFQSNAIFWEMDYIHPNEKKLNANTPLFIPGSIAEQIHLKAQNTINPPPQNTNKTYRDSSKTPVKLRISRAGYSPKTI